MRQIKQTVLRMITISTITIFVCAPMLIAQIAQAAPTYVSPNYGVDEVFMGAGGLNDASSLNYRARASLGDLTVGNTSSDNYQAYGGFTTNQDPFIEFYVNGVNVDLGLLTTDAPKTTTASFTMRTYLASGYAVVSNSDPPTNSSYQMKNLTSQTTSSPGTEQFGINLVSNTLPVVFGADPVQIPDSTYSFGQVANGYQTANQFKYVKGETIAFSNKSSGTTEFTISYLFNISPVTPGGEFRFIHDLVATSYF